MPAPVLSLSRYEVMNIIICNAKGGAGKSTLAVLLAAALAEAGRAVAVRDLDRQGTARAWLEDAGHGKVEAYDPAGRFDVVFIDTAPRLEELPAALAGADLIVIVTGPSPADLWTTKATAEAVKAALPRGARIRLLFNQVSAHTLLGRSLPAIAERVGVKALRSTIARRQCYQHSMVDGWPALTAAAREEVLKAALEIITA